MHTGTQEKIIDFIDVWARPTCWYWRVSWKVKGVAVVHCGDKDPVAEILRSTHGCELSQRLPFWQQCLSPSNRLLAPGLEGLRPNNQQGRKTAPQGRNTAPPINRLPKVFLTSEPPLNTLLDMVLPTRGRKPSSTHQREASHKEAYIASWTSLSQQEAETRRKRTTDTRRKRTSILEPLEWRLYAEKETK